MIQALTTDERAELNAWIAEHVFGYTDVQPIPNTRAQEGKHPEHGQYRMIPNFFNWTHAGPLFDRYEMILYKRDDGVYIYRSLDDLDYDVYVARGATGPEAIAKAVRAYHEMGAKA